MSSQPSSIANDSVSMSFVGVLVHSADSAITELLMLPAGGDRLMVMSDLTRNANV